MSIELLGTDWTPFIVLCLFVVLAFLVPHWIRAFHRTDESPRAFSGRVDPEGDDWFASVAPYFNVRREADERTARAVDHAVYDREAS